MSSSPVAEPSSPAGVSPSVTSPPSPALPVARPFHSSTPNYIGKKPTQPPLHVILPPASPAIPPTYGEPTLTPPPRSPGTGAIASPSVSVVTPSGDSRHHPPDGTSSDKSSETAVGGVSRTASTALSRKESYKAQRQHYRREKKRAASALLHSIEDPSVVVLADWLKVRGSLKSWTKLWCVLKPGLLLLYKSPKAKSSHWVGTVLLTSCQVIERPSKKDGFCFKLYHPLEQSIWAPRGPHNETIGAVVQPLPTAHLIFRAPSQAAGHCWLDGLELALRCSNAMLRCSRSRAGAALPDAPASQINISHEELEKHFNEHAEFTSCSTPVPLMCVSDYSPKRRSSSERKETKTKPHRKLSKWAQFVESIELLSKDNEYSSDSQTPESDNKKDHGFLDFLKKKDSFERNTTFTSSVKHLVEKKVQKQMSKSLASSPSKVDSIAKRTPIMKCFEMPKIPLSLRDKNDKDKTLSPTSFIEDNLLKLVTSFPKRRSSTPCTVKSLTQKRISELRESGVKTDSENDDFLKCAMPKKKIKLNASSEVICATPENIIITKTAPSIERFRRYSSSSTDEVCDENTAKYRKSPQYRTFTPEKYSLIDYHNLPSDSFEALQCERRDDRFSSQNVYVAGKIVRSELAGAASDTDSEVSHEGMPEAKGNKTKEEARKKEVLERIANNYYEDPDTEIGASGEITEEVAEENKSLLWFLLKQVRPGMDLSKVVLPTFILEPRSFLDKLSDSYYHADILALAHQMEDPYLRFKCVLRWYLSGLYKKPKGLKKPYNPVLGEVFRCAWRQKHSDALTYYVAEQVSHHPPVSAFYVSNRKEGFVIEGSLLARSKFYGNSTSAILEGCARIFFPKWGETYITTAPYAHCKGIVIGTLSMELGGKVHVICNESGYSAEIEFKLRSFLSSADSTNAISGRIKKGKDHIAHVDGYWDGKIDIKEKKTGEESTLLDVAVLKEQRMTRLLVKQEFQQEFESQRLWSKVSQAISNDDQKAATVEKTVIEEGQRGRTRNLVAPWVPRFFTKDMSILPDAETLEKNWGIIDQGWRYNYSNINPWQPNEIIEYEKEFVIESLLTGGAVSTTELATVSRHEIGVSRHELSAKKSLHRVSDSDSGEGARRAKSHTRTLKQTLLAIDVALRDQTHAIERLAKTVETISETQKSAVQFRPQNVGRVPTTTHSWDLFGGFVLALVLQAMLNWIFYHKD